MAFEWQQRDKAAETLEVGIETLQAWIDSGQAPSRVQNGQVEVLIEFPDEEDDASGADPEADRDVNVGAEEEPSPFGGPTSAGSGGSGGSGGATVAGGDAASQEHPLEVVSRRELQMAGGMVAAWQRLAETADHELIRSRRFGALAWSIVAALVLLGGVGLWWSTRTVSNTQAQATLTEHELSRVRQDTASDRDRIGSLETRVEQLTADLSETRAQLAGAAAENSNLAEQYRLIQQTADAQARSSQALAQTLRSTIAEQRDRIEGLEADLSQARLELADTREQLTDALTELRQLPEPTPEQTSNQTQEQAQEQTSEQQISEQTPDQPADAPAPTPAPAPAPME